MRPARIAALCAVLALSASGAAPARMHPLHTTLTQVTEERGTATLWVRAFADDFERGVGRSTAPVYLGRSVRMWTKDGRVVRFTACGERRSADLRWFCLRASVPGGVRGARVLNAMQFAVYNDQVNIVQAEYGGRKTSLLFVSGDAPRRLP
jgi:hypothetical protein